MSAVSLVLKCKHCDHRPDPDSVVEAQLLHFQVEHDTDDVAFDLVAICECGDVMVFDRTTELGGTRDVLDHFTCSCTRTGWVRRRNR